MRPNLYTLATAVLLLSTGGGLFAEESATKPATVQLTDSLWLTDEDQPAESAPDPASVKDEAVLDSNVGEPDTSHWMNNPYLAFERLDEPIFLAARFGWWGVGKSGSTAQVGEWQGLDSSSPFFDVDGLFSNGDRTVDFFITGPESQSTMAGLHYYNGPGLTFDADYRRFIHRLGPKAIGGPADADGFAPAGGFYNPTLANTEPGSVLYGSGDVVGRDLTNLGDDYAIRVQQVDAQLKGNLSENVSWKINFWGMKKEGTRQANSQQHCWNQTPGPTDPPGGTPNRTCHVISQGQSIDWTTMEVEPVIEARFSWGTIEYSRTMRSFDQNDQMVYNSFNSIRPAYGLQATGAYGYVPENYTEIDRIKFGSQLADHTDLYVLGFVGNTHNKFRESDRGFYGVDVRVTDRTFNGLKLVGYGKTHTQNNAADTTSLNTRYPGQAGDWLEWNANNGDPLSPQDFYPVTTGNAGGPGEQQYLGLVDRRWTKVGFKTRWNPFWDRHGLARRFAVTGGYEWGQLQRNQVTYELDNLGEFTQPTTVTNTFHVGVEQDWSYNLNTYLRYRLIANSWPMVGVTERAELDFDAAINSSLPEREGRIEMGGTWTVTDAFMLSASLWVRNSYNHSEYVDFSENDYPLTLTAWYAPSERWSLSAGYASFTNWINQDITLGRENGFNDDGTPNPGELPAWTSRWNYTGRSDVVNLAASYAYSQRMRLFGELEYVRAQNFFNTPPSPPTAVDDYSDIPGYSAVGANIYRVGLGFDYQLRQYINSYFRYNYYDYDATTMTYNGGTAHMLMGGLTGTF